MTPANLDGAHSMAYYWQFCDVDVDRDLPGGVRAAMTRRSAEARLLSRIVRVGLLLAVGAQILWSFTPSQGETLSATAQQGRSLFEANCSTCHGLGAEGTENGPSLQGVGAASVDFMLSTGRMPLAAPDDQPTRQPPKFSDEEIDAFVAYLAEIAPGGPPIPDVAVSRGDLPTGASLFLNNCSGCHSAAGIGDSVGGGQIAPDLAPASATQIGEADQGRPRPDAGVRRRQPLRTRRRFHRRLPATGCGTTGTRAVRSSGVSERSPKGSWRSSSGWGS